MGEISLTKKFSENKRKEFSNWSSWQTDEEDRIIIFPEMKEEVVNGSRNRKREKKRFSPGKLLTPWKLFSFNLPSVRRKKQVDCIPDLFSVLEFKEVNKEMTAGEYAGKTGLFSNSLKKILKSSMGIKSDTLLNEIFYSQMIVLETIRNIWHGKRKIILDFEEVRNRFRTRDFELLEESLEKVSIHFSAEILVNYQYPLHLKSSGKEESGGKGEEIKATESIAFQNDKPQSDTFRFKVETDEDDKEDKKGNKMFKKVMSQGEMVYEMDMEPIAKRIMPLALRFYSSVKSGIHRIPEITEDIKNLKGDISMTNLKSGIIMILVFLILPLFLNITAKNSRVGEIISSVVKSGEFKVSSVLFILVIILSAGIFIKERKYEKQDELF